MSYDEELYEQFSELITQSYEFLLDFQAYREEAIDSQDVEYRREAVARAFSSADQLHSIEKEWEFLLETFPSQVETVEDLVLNTEPYSDRLQIFDLDLEEDKERDENHDSDVEMDGEFSVEPTEEEMAAINAVRDNYELIREYDMLSFWRELQTEVGDVELKMRV